MIVSNYRIGMRVHGRVTGIQPYGAFVTLDGEHQGLIHISECHEGYVKSITEYLKVGQAVDVIILDIDEYTGKISLSLRCIEHQPHPTVNDLEIYKTFRHKHFWTNRHVHAGFEPIANHLASWTSDSLNRLKAGEYQCRKKLPVRAGHSPLASVLWDLRYTIGIDVDQLRLYDSIMAELDDEKVAVFVFDHLAVDGQVRAKFDRQGLEFVLASELHELFTSVRVSETMPFTNLSK